MHFMILTATVLAVGKVDVAGSTIVYWIYYGVTTIHDWSHKCEIMQLGVRQTKDIFHKPSRLH